MNGPAIAAVVPAAGRGERLGAAPGKALLALAGRPMVSYAVRTLAASRVALVVVAAPPGRAPEVDAVLADAHAGADLVVVEGGASRTASVRAALAVLPASVQVVLVHDAARPLVPAALVEAVLAAVEGGADAVVPAVAVPDTVKVVDEQETVLTTLDRTRLRSVQTPQGFRRSVLERAYAVASGAVTDDAGLVELAGGRVLVVPGADEAFKVTRPLDLVLAEAMLAGRPVLEASGG